MLVQLVDSPLYGPQLSLGVGGKLWVRITTNHDNVGQGVPGGLDLGEVLELPVKVWDRGVGGEGLVHSQLAVLVSGKRLVP